MVNTSSSSSSLLDNASLAQMLRECASLVERNEHSALLYKAVEALNAYAESNGHTPASAPKSTLTRPSFQRPTNQKSNLIANGWIEQIRRSKFRTIWKEVLASLVEARQPGEETTLWIQRETMSKTTNGTGKGTTTLEAIHQIPMKWLLDVKLLDFYGDFRFSIKVYNVPEDFVFRTRDEESCREWVATLISAKESSNSKRATEAAAEVNFPDLLGKESKKDNSNSNNGGSGSHHSDSSKYEFPDLDMNTGNPKPSAPPMMNHGSTTSSTATAAAAAAAASNSSRNSNGSTESRSSTARNVNHDKGQDATTSTQSKNRMSIKELRAIAHGAGYDTRGMERSDLEKIAAYYAPVSEKTGQYKQQQQQQQQQPKQNGSNHSQQHGQQQQRPPPNREEEKRQEASRMQEEMRKQAEARMKEEEMKRKQQQQPQPQPQQKQNQQHAWQHQSSWNTPPNSFGASSATSSPRRPNPSQNMFESTRFFSYEAKSGESGPRRKQPFPSQQPHQQFPAKPQTYAPPPEPSPAASTAPPSFNYQQRTAPPNPPPPPQSTSMPQNSNQQRTCDPTSPLNQKYAKAMAANQQPTASVQDEQAIISSIKRNILITWALVPPQYNMLRPIDQLLSSIHKVFPPFSNVASHDYFSKWQPINHPDLLLGSVMSGADEAKLKKAVRKLRVFLHPDRLPKEFDSKQSFVCKMLWDVSNDAYEEFLKSKEDLDWIGS